MDIVSLHRLDQHNPGDLWASPLRYMPFEGRYFDVAADPIELSCDLLILGGGGIVSQFDPWRSRIETWMSKITARKAVVWGADVTPGFADLAVRGRFDLVGARNVDSTFELVPCASCMHPAFDDRPDGEGTGIISHKKRRIPGEHIANAPNDFDTVVGFIKSKAAIVSASYHAIYWSILLDRRAYIYDSPDYQKKLASKMYAYESQPPFVKNLDEVAEREAEAARTGALSLNASALERYRAMNRAFADRVFALLDARSPWSG